jgi:hypothetical protein
MHGGLCCVRVVLGWFTYFTNRYRKGEVQFTDLATLLGVIGGGAVTALFGDAKTTLFGAYGIGLAVGFFAYFLTLIVLVRRSKGVFTLAWFLDGRRRRLEDDEEIPGDSRGSGVAMSLRRLQYRSHRDRRRARATRSAARPRHRVDAEVLRDLARRTGEETIPTSAGGCESRAGGQAVELGARGLDGLTDSERSMAESSYPTQETAR